MTNHLIALGVNPLQIAQLPNEEICRAQAAKFISLTSKTPIVLAFFSPTSPNEVAVEEIFTPKIGGQVIDRTIEFAPEYYQAGVGLLSYFGEVLRQKDPKTNAKVRIEQQGNIVRLHIESESGDIETIEKELEQYALVINNQAPPESLFENRAHIIQLEHRLEVARIELKQAHDLRQLTHDLNSQRISNLDQDIASLRSQLAVQIVQTGQIIQLAAQQVSSSERVQTALLTHSQMLFKDLVSEAASNQRLADAVNSLQHHLLSGIAAIDIEDKLEEALSTIQQTKPGFLSRIYSGLEGAAYKASASSAFAWVMKWIGQHKQ